MTRKETILNMSMTGQTIKRIMKAKGYTVKDIQNHLSLSTPQAIYHWFDGKSMPTIDNLYSLSDLFGIPIDLMLRGNRRIMFAPYWDDRCGRLYTYYERLTMVLLT